ncbi:acyl carrier protein [Actinomadura opuntiae]|uniref:acyl carrier protein n=1 Tax=Actinomadura sp. OS1-43 TaxID=604315 RepID=UPI00255B0C12|nr:acyl carrier protein [Actinomadura sp. OS1-43]MDL4815431.1 acyl carrier protein [Actinomadura sp. OS1-43]
MNIDDFVALVRDELGLPVTAADAGRSFDELPGWDSVHLLWLLTTLERETGRPLSLPDVLEAGSLAQLHALAVAA